MASTKKKAHKTNLELLKRYNKDAYHALQYARKHMGGVDNKRLWVAFDTDNPERFLMICTLSRKDYRNLRDVMQDVPGYAGGVSGIVDMGEACVIWVPRVNPKRGAKRVKKG